MMTPLAKDQAVIWLWQKEDRRIAAIVRRVGKRITISCTWPDGSTALRIVDRASLRRPGRANAAP